jgi:hypothetical protein
MQIIYWSTLKTILGVVPCIAMKARYAIEANLHLYINVVE